MAPELTGTLKKIIDSGSITVGYRNSAIPFSYLTGDSDPVGYSHDLSNAVVEALGRHLGMSTPPKVNYVLCTAETRISLVQNGTIDLECGSTTDNESRQGQIAFSSSFFESSVRLLTKTVNSQEYSDFSYLDGKRVVAVLGTTAERIIKTVHASNGTNISFINASDYREALRILESGRTVAFIADEVLLEGQRAAARQPDNWVVTGTPQPVEYYGFGMRSGDAPLKKVVDDALASYFKSGEGKKSYEKWFEAPIPLLRSNVKLHKSEWLKNLID